MNILRFIPLLVCFIVGFWGVLPSHGAAQNTALLPVLPAAQGTTECPANVLLALARSNAACSRTERNQLCYGNGTVTAELSSSASDFDRPGELMAARDVRAFSVTSDPMGEFSAATLLFQANLIDTQAGRSAVILAYGSATVENLVPVIPEVRVTATGTLNVRRMPQENGEIIQQFPLRTTLAADGRTRDGQWLRVQMPDTGAIGWVSINLITIEGNINSLEIVNVDTPYLRPFQIITLQTGTGDAFCDGAPSSGVLMQTPEAAIVEMTVNGAVLRFSATAHIQAQAGGNMTISVIQGIVIATVGSAEQYIPAGARAMIPLDADGMAAGAPTAAEPFIAADLAGAPINNLPTRVIMPPPATPEQIVTAINTAIESQIMRPTPDPAIEARTRCTRTVTRTINIWAGPATFYEVIREIPADSRVDVVYRVVDSSGTTWYQLRTGGWIQASAVRSSEACGEVPITEVVQPPRTNTLIMETCDTTNGPIRAGQYVTIEFTDGGWETIAEAQEAPRIDPGRISVNTTRLRVYAGAPVQVAPERFYRRFNAEWRAEAGTWRIFAERLTYSLICDITVPAN